MTDDAADVVSQCRSEVIRALEGVGHLDSVIVDLALAKVAALPYTDRDDYIQTVAATVIAVVVPVLEAKLDAVTVEAMAWQTKADALEAEQRAFEAFWKLKTFSTIH